MLTEIYILSLIGYCYVYKTTPRWTLEVLKNIYIPDIPIIVFEELWSEFKMHPTLIGWPFDAVKVRKYDRNIKYFIHLQNVKSYAQNNEGLPSNKQRVNVMFLTLMSRLTNGLRAQ